MLTVMIVYLIKYISKRLYDHAQKPSTRVFTNQILKHKYSPLNIFKFSKHIEYIHTRLCMLSEKVFLPQKSRKRMRE